jgi:hypothetical protein
MLAHQAANLLRIDDDALLSESSAHAAIAVGLEYFADGLDPGDDLGGVRLHSGGS